MTVHFRFATAVAALAAVVCVSGVMLAPQPNASVSGPAASPSTVPTPAPSFPEPTETGTASEPSAKPPPSPSAIRAPVVSNGWIAYSTVPGDQQDGAGSDIYLVHEGGEPRRIAWRGAGFDVFNVCPAFSPDGTKLAFGEGTGVGRAVVVLTVDLNGLIGETPRLTVPGAGPAPCPRWSDDGTRVAYLDGGQVVVRRLDGSSAISADPPVGDFDLDREWDDPVLSPAGDLTARTGEVGIVVSRADGSDARTVATGSYAFGGWSPDGRRILHMQDISGIDFALRATTVESPFETVTIVPSVRINNSRSFPGLGDVSWQPVFR
jgi:Tol biopolymer transport system component